MDVTISILDNELEETFCKIVDMVGVKISDRDIKSGFREDTPCSRHTNNYWTLKKTFPN